MSRRLQFLSCLAALSAAPGLTLAQSATEASHPWTVDDVLAMKSVSDVAISPDGKTVAYVVTVRDVADDVNNSDIWLVSTGGGTPRQLTNGARADRAPQWAPDGSWIAFLSDRNDKKTMQVYGVDPVDGKTWQISKHEMAVSSFTLSPDGKRIAFIAKTSAPPADVALEKERGRPIVRDSAYTSDFARLWSLAVNGRDTATAKIASPDGLDVMAVVWGPDSRSIAWTAKPTPTLRGLADADVFVQSEPGAEPRRVTTMPGPDEVVGWPADLGLIVSGSGQAIGTDNERLWLVSIVGGNPAVSLTDALDENPRYVSASAKELYVEAAVKTGRALYRIPLASGKAAGPPQKVTDDKRFYSGFAASATGGMMACIGESATDAPDVYASPAATFAARRLTTTNPQASQFDYGQQQVIAWKSAADSETIEGVLTLPAGYEKGKKVPLLLVIHGGPSGVSSNRYPSMRGAYPTAVFSSLGYAVLQPNYRGSTGYGQRFRGLNRGDISGKDWVDVNSGVDAVIRMGVVDTTKMGIMGWSFGGHHTYWGITHTDRFSAASAGAGANDLVSMYSETDIPEFYLTYLGPRPWEDFALYDARSSFRFVKNVGTPLLIQVGEADRRVPAEQSIEFYEAVKEMNKVPVKLVEYPGQPHGITDPRLTRDLMERNVSWFSYYLPVAGNKPALRPDNLPDSK